MKVKKSDIAKLFVSEIGYVIADAINGYNIVPYTKIAKVLNEEFSIELIRWEDIGSFAKEEMHFNRSTSGFNNKSDGYYINQINRLRETIRAYLENDISEKGIILLSEIKTIKNPTNRATSHETSNPYFVLNLTGV